MLQREFTFKEKVLLAIFILLAISIFYYQFVFKGVRNGIRQFSTENLEEQIVTETARMSKDQTDGGCHCQHREERPWRTLSLQ